jgi:hypothetical protein
MKFEGWFNSATETQLWVNHKQTTPESIENSYFVCWGWYYTIYENLAYFDIVGLIF